MAKDEPLERWPEPAARVGEALLVLDEPPAEGEEPIGHDVSAAAVRGDTLFLAADECAALEVLDRVEPRRFASHRRVQLGELFDLPGGAEEMDIEGLAIQGDWLWLVGSHSLTRKKPKKKKAVTLEALERMAELKDNHNRMVLGRVPLKALDHNRFDIDLDGERKPQMLPIGKHRSAVLKSLRKNPLLAPFLEIPSKENGLDVEGLMVDGERVGLGLRGPVINGWACVLELHVAANGGELELKGEVKPHWLDLGGLGVRDMKRRGEDVILLAGPTMSLDGPVQLYRWRGWTSEAEPESLLHKPERLMDLPFGYRCDHPEALAPFEDGELLVVCDTPAPRRLTRDGLMADVFRY